MTEYCSHWYPRYVLVKRKYVTSFLLVDNYLGHSSEECPTLLETINSCLNTDYSASADLGNLQYIIPIAESNLLFTKQSHPELFV